MQVLKDLSELINLSLSQAQNHQPLSGSTTFHRIETASSQDALNGNLLLNVFFTELRCYRIDCFCYQMYSFYQDYTLVHMDFTPQKSLI